jgi:hypothetical protein
VPRPLKPDATRRRRNKASTRATLPPAGSGLATPPMPDHRKEWHPRTAENWALFWASPMATQLLPADRPGVDVANEMLEVFWRHPNGNNLKAVLAAWRPYGWTPIDRLRLQWKMAPPDEAKRPEAEAPREPAKDPREVLRMVK